MSDPLDDFLFLGIYKLKATQGDEDNVMRRWLVVQVGSGVTMTLVFYHEVTLWHDEELLIKINSILLQWQARNYWLVLRYHWQAILRFNNLTTEISAKFAFTHVTCQFA